MEEEDQERWLTFQGLIEPFKEKVDHSQCKEQRVDVHM